MKRKILLLSLALSLVFTGCGKTIEETETISESETTKESEIETETESSKESIESESIESETETEESEIVSYDDMSEEDYKANCKEMWHDDIFFCKNDLTGSLVKVDLFLAEQKFFSEDAIYNETAVSFIKQYNLQRNLFSCGVKRDSESIGYVGGQLYLYFSDDYGMNATDFKEGSHVTVYGQIIDFSTNTTSGYNDCGIIPKYIESND